MKKPNLRMDSILELDGLESADNSKRNAESNADPLMETFNYHKALKGTEPHKSFD